jgi:uroporphyrinogen decarboxylase
MNARERYIATLTFGNPDKVYLSDGKDGLVGKGRESTLKRWRSEGLPKGVDPLSFVLDELGIQREQYEYIEGLFVDSKMHPQFEEKVLSHENNHYIVQDWMGAITEISDQYDYTYLRMGLDFVTRKWHKFPVSTREDWAEMKKRYNPRDPIRFPANLPELGKKLKNRSYPLVIKFNGPFWQLREWLGMENLCIALLDQPEFVMEMIEFWTNFVLEIMSELLPHVQMDHISLQEDMAFKAHPMIGPDMTREFILPSYTKWVKLMKQYDVPICGLNSDGFIEDLIPVWIDGGINTTDPMEVAAGNDINHYRKLFGRKLSFSGGIDKRAIARGGKVLEEEVKRIEPVVKDGGYIPGCDHAVPNDVSFVDYKYFVKLVAQISGWL